MSILFMNEVNSNTMSFIINNDAHIYNVISEGTEVVIYDMFSNERVEDKEIIDFIKNRVH